jgi:hypothetical protein
VTGERAGWSGSHPGDACVLIWAEKLTGTMVSSVRSGRRRSQLVGTRASRLDSFKTNKEDDKAEVLDTGEDGVDWYELEHPDLIPSKRTRVTRWRPWTRCWSSPASSGTAPGTRFGRRERGCLAEVRVRHERRRRLEQWWGDLRESEIKK